MFPLKISKSVRLIAILLFFVTTAVHFDKAFANPSLSSKDRIDELVVEIDGEKRSFTVIGDARNKKAWFYIPDKPRLVEREIRGNKEKVPEFTLLRYAGSSSIDDGLTEDGLLQFAIRLALSPGEVELLKVELAKKVRLPVEQIDLSSLPFKSATVSLYSDDKKLFAEGGLGKGVAPTFATQQMAFTVPLTKVGASVIEALSNGQGGMHVAVVYTYEGWTTPLGFECTADYEKAHDFYSKNTKFGAQASYMGLFGGGTEIDKTKIRETLEENSIVNCETWAKGTELDDQVNTILSNIQSEIVKSLTPPEDLSATAVELDLESQKGKGDEEEEEDKKKKKKKGWLGKLLGGFSADVQYNMKLVDMKSVRKGSKTVGLKKRNLEIRKSNLSGFIGIGKYSEKMRSTLVLELNVEHGWPAAYFLLPPVGDAIGIQSITAEVSLPNSKTPGKAAEWTLKTGWQNFDTPKKPISKLSFTLLGIPEADKKRLNFDIVMTIARGRNIVTVKTKRPITDSIGQKNLSSPVPFVQVLTVDGAYLSWRKIQAESNLLAANISLLLSNGKKLRASLRPRNVEAKFVQPLPLIFLVGNEVTGVTPEISYIVNGKLDPVQSLNNGKRINMGGEGETTITLQDVEYQ